MKECTVVGRPNSGKTMFTLNFAAFLGSKKVDLTFRTYDNLLTCRHLHIDDAKKELCGTTAHKTRTLQSLVLRIPVSKSHVAVKLTDTCGLSENIHNDETVRKGMAQTLKLLRQTDYIIHIIDISLPHPEEYGIDREIYSYGLARRNYVMLANKIDLSSARENIARISSSFPKVPIIPVSALYNLGFKEVKAHVARNI